VNVVVVLGLWLGDDVWVVCVVVEFVVFLYFEWGVEGYCLVVVVVVVGFWFFEFVDFCEVVFEVVSNVVGE